MSQSREAAAFSMKRAKRYAAAKRLTDSHVCVANNSGGCAHLLCLQIRDAIDRVLAVAWKLSSIVRAFASRLGGMVAEAAWVREQWREHDAAMRALVYKVQTMQSDRDLRVREFAKVRRLPSVVYLCVCVCVILQATERCVSSSTSQHLCVRLNFNAFYPEQDA